MASSNVVWLGGTPARRETPFRSAQDDLAEQIERLRRRIDAIPVPCTAPARPRLTLIRGGAGEES